MTEAGRSIYLRGALAPVATGANCPICVFPSLKVHVLGHRLTPFARLLERGGSLCADEVKHGSGLGALFLKGGKPRSLPYPNPCPYSDPTLSCADEGQAGGQVLARPGTREREKSLSLTHSDSSLSLSHSDSDRSRGRETERPDPARVWERSRTRGRERTPNSLHLRELSSQMKGKLDGKSSRVLELATRLSFLTQSVFKVVLQSQLPPKSSTYPSPLLR